MDRSGQEAAEAQLEENSWRYDRAPCFADIAGIPSAEKIEAKKPAGQLRKRPLAILVKRNDDPFPELLKTIRTGVDGAQLGKSISRLRETKNGSLLIEVIGGTAAAEQVRHGVEQTLGSEASVKTMGDSALIELRDLDGLSDAEEVREAIVRETSTSGEVKVISIRRTFGGGQLAIVAVSSETAKTILQAGWLRVGLVYSRVRESERHSRCFRCLAYGHHSRDCQGPDRGKSCWRCRAEGHYAASCDAPREKAETFRQELLASTKDTRGSGLPSNRATAEERLGTVQSLPSQC